MKPINEYFKRDYQVFLDEVKYKKYEIDKKATCDLTLRCRDDLKAEVIDNKFVELRFTRELVFEPVKLFELSVTFCARLFFIDEIKSEIDLEKIDMTEELKKAEPEILGGLVSRASLIISQLTTSSFGNAPVITPPTMTLQNE